MIVHVFSPHHIVKELARWHASNLNALFPSSVQTQAVQAGVQLIHLLHNSLMFSRLYAQNHWTYFKHRHRPHSCCMAEVRIIHSLTLGDEKFAVNNRASPKRLEVWDVWVGVLFSVWSQTLDDYCVISGSVTKPDLLLIDYFSECILQELCRNIFKIHKILLDN